MRLVLLTTFLLGTLFGCGLDRYTWNQRMTVTVETPEGVVSASSVIEVRAVFDENPSGLSANIEVYYRYTGEAVALEVRPGQWLFALMGGPAELMYRAAPERYSSRMRGEWLAEIPEQTEPVELVGEMRPRMATVVEMGNPDSAAFVDPDDLEAHFGPGVRLLSVELEVTDDPPTTGRLEEILRWWWLIGVGPENEVPSLRVFNDTPRGWTRIGLDDFWSFDLRQELFERYQ